MFLKTFFLKVEFRLMSFYVLKKTQEKAIGAVSSFSDFVCFVKSVLKKKIIRSFLKYTH